MQIQRINSQQPTQNPAFGTKFNVAPEAIDNFQTMIEALNVRYFRCGTLREIHPKDSNKYRTSMYEQKKIQKATMTIRAIAREIFGGLRKHNELETKNIFKTGVADEAEIKSVNLIGFKKTRTGGETLTLDASNIAKQVKEGVSKFGIILKTEAAAPTGKLETTLAITADNHPRKMPVFKDIEADQPIKGNLITYVQNEISQAPF